MFAVLTTAATVSSLRNRVIGYLFPNQRIVLSTLKASLGANTAVYTLLKVQKGIDILLEVYEETPSSHDPEFRAQAVIPGSRDAVYSQGGKTANLALVPAKNENILLILVPTISFEGQTQIHLWRWDENSLTLIPVLNSDF